MAPEERSMTACTAGCGAMAVRRGLPFSQLPETETYKRHVGMKQSDHLLYSDTVNMCHGTPGESAAAGFKKNCSKREDAGKLFYVLSFYK